MIELLAYPDETFYSFLSRLRRYVIPEGKEIFNRTLFGKAEVCHSLHFPSGIGRFLESYPYLTESEVMEMTLIPFFSLFLSEHKQKRIRAETCKKNSRLKVFTGLNTSRFCPEKIRYCPVCAKEDIEKFGEAYLHRSHSLPGNAVCLKHQCKLLEYISDKDEVITEEPVYLKEERLDLENVIPAGPDELKLAESLKDLQSLVRSDKTANRDTVRSGLKRALERNGRHVSGRLDIRGICEDLESFYGPGFLKARSLNITSGSNARNWIYRTVKGDRSLDPVYVAVLSGCYCASADELTLAESPVETCGAEQERDCSNPVCSGGPMVLLPQIREGRVNSKLDYRCPDCGRIISVKEGGVKETVLQYGDLWDRELRALKKQGLSNMEIGRRLGISNSSIPAHLKTAHHHDIDEKVEWARKELSEACSEGITRTRFYREHRKAYRILEQYDLEWFSDCGLFREAEGLPEYDRFVPEKTDGEILQALQEAYRKLLLRPERITAKALAREAGVRTRSSRLSRYPESDKFLRENIESVTDYYIRYGKLTVDRFRKNGIRFPTRTQLAAVMNDKRRLYQSEIWGPVQDYISKTAP